MMGFFSRRFNMRSYNSSGTEQGTILAGNTDPGGGDQLGIKRHRAEVRSLSGKHPLFVSGLLPLAGLLRPLQALFFFQSFQQGFRSGNALLIF